MLAHVLALAVGLSSLVLFLTAFSMSDIHQRDDFLWSGVGLFYALVLWFCASRITGSLLLGQAAAVALVISFNWQNLKLRKAIAHPEEAVDTDGFSVTELISGFFNRSSESNPQPNIDRVSEEETNDEEPTTEIQYPVSTATETETVEETPSSTLGKTDFEEPTTEIQYPVSTATEPETTEETPSSTLGKTDFEEPITKIQYPVSTATEPETIKAESSNEVSFSKTESEEVISVQETTEVEENAEEINEEKPIDVKFTTSEIKENPKSSIDDFLAELDKGIDKPSEDK